MITVQFEKKILCVLFVSSLTLSHKHAFFGAHIAMQKEARKNRKWWNCRKFTQRQKHLLGPISTNCLNSQFYRQPIVAKVAILGLLAYLFLFSINPFIILFHQWRKRQKEKKLPEQIDWAPSALQTFEGEERSFAHALKSSTPQITSGWEAGFSGLDLNKEERERERDEYLHIYFF